MDEREPEKADPFLTLGIARDATHAEIRAAYFGQVRAHPPERDAEGFKRVREAYEQLRSPRKRAELTLLELRQGPAEFDLDRLHDAPPPPFPERWLDHLTAIALAQLDVEIDAGVAAERDAIHRGQGAGGNQGGATC